MKNNHCIDYLAPKTQVIYFDPRMSFMVTSSVGNSSQESFQNENDFQSIW